MTLETSCCNSKAPWRDGTTHISMSPLELMQRLAALVPRPRLHLIRYHGVLAANVRLRASAFGQIHRPLWGGTRP